MRLRNISIDNSAGKIYSSISSNDVLISGILLQNQDYYSPTTTTIAESKFPLKKFYFPNQSIIKSITLTTQNVPKSVEFIITPKISTNAVYESAVADSPIKYTITANNTVRTFTYTYPDKKFLLPGQFMWFDFTSKLVVVSGIKGTGLNIVLTYYRG